LISVLYNGTEYVGRLISINSIAREVYTDDGTAIKNEAYNVLLIDAFGAMIGLTITDLSDIIPL
jgi:hypothetical protein